MDMTSNISGVPRSNAEEETWVRRDYRILTGRLKQFLKTREVKNFRTAMKRKMDSFSKPEELLSPLQPPKLHKGPLLQKSRPATAWKSLQRCSVPFWGHHSPKWSHTAAKDSSPLHCYTSRLWSAVLKHLTGSRQQTPAWETQSLGLTWAHPSVLIPAWVPSWFFWTL